MKYAIIGSHLEGNQGAASMLESAIQTLSKTDPKAEYRLLSVYPAADARRNPFEALRIARADPVYLATVINPLALMYRLVPPARPLLRRNGAIRAIAEADVFLDQGGITFVDGREIFLLYNVASVLPALLVGTPVIKCAQAMGPFHSLINRITARFLLPRMSRILARGPVTEQHLRGLGLDNVRLVADYAFCLTVSDSEAERARDILQRSEFREDALNIGIFPSEVMNKKYAKKGLSYQDIMAETISRICEELGATVYLIPHSTRRTQKRHNNDAPLCTEIQARLKDSIRCRYISEIDSPQQLRYLIGQFDAVIVARFHAMISALATATPLLVTGWSHKYREVLGMFELEHCAVEDEYSSSPEALVQALQSTLRNRKESENRMRSHLPEVNRKALEHVGLITEAAKLKTRSH